MHDPRSRQGEAVQERFKRGPRQTSLTPPIQCAKPNTPNMMGERRQRAEVARQAEVRKMAPQHLTQPTMLVAHRLMPSTLRFLVQRLELPRHALSLRLPFDNEPAVSSPPRVMREAEKGERAKPTLPALVALVTLWCTRGTNPRKTRRPAQS